jgi:TRAP-type C4-dicarboxylate transport system permease small subunit
VSGWGIVAWTTGIVGCLVAGLLAGFGSEREGIQLVLRWTARTTAVLFFAAFAASSLRRLWPTPTSRWLLANRRYLGVSAGVSHTYHLGAVLVLLSLPGQGRDPASLIPTALAYVFLYLMVATSFDRSAAWLGRRRWQLLHRVGGYYIWGVLVFTFATAGRPLSAVFALLGLATLALRIAAWRREVQKASAPA